MYATSRNSEIKLHILRLKCSFTLDQVKQCFDVSKSKVNRVFLGLLASGEIYCEKGAIKGKREKTYRIGNKHCFFAEFNARPMNHAGLIKRDTRCAIL